MILGDDIQKKESGGGRTTLDDVFRRAAERRPDALALVDPPDRAAIDGVAPRRLTYAQADRMISAIAGRLRRIGLSTDAVVGMQLANTVESMLTFLGILRAGMIASPLPLLWRRADCIAALSRIGAKGLITCGKRGDVDHCRIAMQVAAEIFPIRYVCGFGTALADGVIPLDDLYEIEKLDPIPPFGRDRKSNPAAHVAAITWDVTADGLVAVARNHQELLAGGIAVVLESRIPQDAVIHATVTPASFAGLTVSLLSWLFSGGTLVLHHPFSPGLFSAQMKEHRCDTLILPGGIVSRLADAGLLSAQDGARTLLAVWRSPERLTGSAAWRQAEIGMVDVMVFGETALLAARRGTDGKPAPIAFGAASVPRGASNAVQVAEILRTEAGTVAIRGPMVPRYAFPPGAERMGVPVLKTARDGYVDTGYTCRVERDSGAMVVTGPPAGLVSVGGYRFGLRDLQDLVSGADEAGTLAALPDPLTGHRLAGHAADREAMRHTLIATGVNPLVVRAFREREQPDAA